MKTTSLLIPAVLATVFAGTAPVVLAEETPAKTEATAPKKAKPHSHAEEKTGVPARPATETKTDKTDAEKKDQHLHPRDGK